MIRRSSRMPYFQLAVTEPALVSLESRSSATARFCTWMHKHQIENQTGEATARNLTEAFDRLCATPA